MPNKRRHVDATPPESQLALPEHTLAGPPMDIGSSAVQSQILTQTGGALHQVGEITPPWEDQKAESQLPKLRMQDTELPNGTNSSVSFLSPYDSTHRKLTDNDMDIRSRHSTVSGPDEEAEVYSMNRMLKDPAGRSLYVGESATLSYLQLIRRCVQLAAGTSPFTDDPASHQLLEVRVALPPDTRLPHHLLPPSETGRVLADAFFTNTMGLIDVFDKKWFEGSMETCYTDPLRVDTCTICLLYLVFAIGLVLANPAPNTEEATIIDRMRSDTSTEWAEMFYRSAKLLGDPVSGFEDSDLWSIQALILMSVYMLTISKRNAAYAYYGMAIRSAFSLGIHRKESLRAVPVQQQELRRRLWKTLFVLDRFLSASLGRPTAISEDDCSEELLYQADATSHQAKDAPGPAVQVVHAEGLKAVVRSSQSIGIILKKVYSKRKISTALAQELTQRSRQLSGKLHSELHWKKADSHLIPGHGIAILHANLFQIHSTLLLTRPFFLYLIHKTQAAQRSGETTSSSSYNRTKLGKFAQACVQASYNTVFLVERAFRDNFLSPRNPFVLYFLFAASLIVLSNEFFGLFAVQSPNQTYETTIENAIRIMKHCAETDPQAKRLLYILNAFRDVVSEHAQRVASRDSSIGATLISSTPSSTFDPMATLPGITYDNTGRAHSIHFEVASFNERKLPPMARHHSLAALSVPSLTDPMTVQVDTSLAMSSITPPNSNSASLEYYRTITTPTSTETAVDALGDTAVIDFDSFWPWVNGTGMTMPSVPAAAGFATNPMAGGSGFGGFTMNSAGGSEGNEFNGNIPMFPSSNFV
ncbi:hypothetical protein DL546_000525 [Coniochaeta pulveracea]|nr:hypothetical protein DL546_000525 [Coniochaeta pulveracea]